MSTVTAAPSLRVQRWTLVSGAFTSSGVALIAALAFVPVVMSESPSNFTACPRVIPLNDGVDAVPRW